MGERKLVGEDAYEERYVAFLDILGFSKLARLADTDLYARDTIRQSIQTFRETLKVYPREDLRFTQFSDCVVLSAPRSENGMLYIFEASIRLAVALLKRGVLLRGGIAIGNLQHSEDLLFGTGLLRAHKHDSPGGPPRIIVDPEIVQDGHETKLFTEKWSYAVREDDFDLSYIVHTLLFADTYHPGLEAGRFLTRTDAEAIATEISLNANDLTADAQVRAKWRWLRAYWNRTVGDKGYLPLA